MGPATAGPPPALTCSVLGESRGRGIVLTGRIRAAGEVAGTFRLLVVKEGPGGRSQVAQGGDFRAGAGVPVSVGHVSLSVEPGARLVGRLEVTTGGRPLACEPYEGERT